MGPGPITLTFPVDAADRPSGSARRHLEGIAAGLIGAAAISRWFFLLDSLQGRPLYTPILLGTALLPRGAELAAPPAPSASFEAWSL